MLVNNRFIDLVEVPLFLPLLHDFPKYNLCQNASKSNPFKRQGFFGFSRFGNSDILESFPLQRISRLRK